MRVLYSPQVNPGKKIEYNFQEEIITVTMDEVSDTFDFTDMPDGVVGDIETIFPINPIIHAERVNGVLSVELLNYIEEDASYIEKFPVWMEV
jgi:hypothetical protein